jgi:hypothetical protein
MDDQTVQDRIETLIEEEQRLLRSGEGHGLGDDDRAQLETLKVELDRCWDLLRQRRAREEFGLDPDEAKPRDADTVERYLQ